VVRCAAVCFGFTPLLLPVAGCTSSTSSPPGSEKKSPDLKWARSVAEDFLGAVKANDAKAAYGLLSPDYRDRLTEKERKEGTFAFSSFMRDDARNAATWSITGEELAPNRIEAKFTGELTFEFTRLHRNPNGGEIPYTETKVYPFTLLITREKDSNLWRADLFTVAKDGKKK
jgi:hypothetical protein